MDWRLLRLAATSPHLVRVAPFAKGAVCFTWDDGCDSHYDAVFPAAQARNQKHTFFITSDLIGTAGYMTSAQVAALSSAGHEIGAHGKTHTDVTGLSTANRVIQYDTSKTTIEGWTGTTITSWAYPYGTRSAGTDSELYLRYDRVRGVTGSTTLPFIYTVDERGDYLIGALSWDGTASQHDILLNAIRLAARAPVIVVVYGHDIDAASSTTTAQMTESMNLCRTLSVPCLTLAEAFPGGNLLRNPGFEDAALNDWVSDITGNGTASVVADTPADGYPGSYSLKLSCSDTASTVYVRQAIPVYPSESYQLAGRYRVASLSGAGSVTAIIRERDYAGAVVSQTATAALTATSWTQFSAARALGDTARMVWVDLQITNLSGDVYFDHLSFQKKTYGAQG